MKDFSTIDKKRILYSDSHFFIIEDAFPVSPGHLLVISKEVKTHFFNLSTEEQSSLSKAIVAAKDIIESTHTPDGYNIGMNCEEAAGQTVFHFHCHVIPRYKGDMENPRGGVRHCIPSKGNY